MQGRFEGRTAVVTGAAQGIGLRIADRLAVEGASLVVGDVDDDKLRQAAEMLKPSQKGAAVAVTGDLSDGSNAQRLIDTAVREFGSLDILATTPAAA